MFNSFKMLLKPGNAVLHPNLLFVDSRSSPRTLGLSTLSGPETKLRGEEVDERPQIFKVLLSASGKVLQIANLHPSKIPNRKSHN